MALDHALSEYDFLSYHAPFFKYGTLFGKKSEEILILTHFFHFSLGTL